jgi:hypothetical protein
MQCIKEWGERTRKEEMLSPKRESISLPVITFFNIKRAF